MVGDTKTAKTTTDVEQYAAPTFMKYSSPDIAKDAAGETVLLSGNEALARGCIEAGVRVATCYPGSPMHYTLHNLVEAARIYPSMHVEWSVNEKCAFEVALGATLTGVRAMTTFKNVGLDVALNAVVCSALDFSPDGLVLIVNDDPDMSATQVAEDIRALAIYSSIPVLEPSTMQEAKDFTAAAFELSEKLHLPVLVRAMYRHGYAREPVVLGRIQHEVRERTPHYRAEQLSHPQIEGHGLHSGPSRWAHAHFHGEVPPPQSQLAKGWATREEAEKAAECFEGNKLTISGQSRVGVISSGLAYRETMEALKNLGWPEEVATLKLAITYPLPRGLIERLLHETETVLVVEEIEPIIENQVRSISAGMDSHAEILGKLTADVPFSGELASHQIGPALAKLIGQEYGAPASAERMRQRQEILQSSVPGGGVGGQCPGCPGPAAAYALKNVSEQLGMADDMRFFSYDGCCGGVPTGERAPGLCMGAGINLAAGLYHAGLKGKQVVLSGDSNFFHGCMSGLVEAVYNKSDVLFYVMDNRTTAMTGHQPHPGGFGITAAGDLTKTLDIAEIARACQADFVATVDPYDQEQISEALKQALTTKGVSVVVSQRTCAVVAQRQKGAADALIFDVRSQVDRDKCLSWAVEMSPCEAACPAHIDVEAYVRAIAKGRFKEALQIVRENNPFASVCGRVCHHPCETDCKRGKLDEPLAINHLKRFVADYEFSNGLEKPTPVPRTREGRVAIVGSGPAGLTAAYHLVNRGYGVTVFEASDVAGGMLTVGIPEFILPQKMVQAEIGHIRDLGVEIKTGVAVGKDLTLDSIWKQGYKAIFIGVGACTSKELGVPGEDSPGVLHGVTFLRDVNLGNEVKLGKRVAVIGGGDVAIDAARCAVRLGCEVSILYRRSRAEMPARDEEIETVEAEGVRIEYLVTPAEILSQNGRVAGLKCTRMELGEPDASGRRQPIPVQGSEFEMDVDTVIPAIGQSPDLSLLAEGSGIETTDAGTLIVDPTTLATTRPGVFAGGDVRTGPATVIEAIADGNKAAASIDGYLRGEDPVEGRGGEAAALPVTGADTLPQGTLARERQRVLELPADKRIRSFDEVKLGFTEQEAIAEARRCLRCKICRRCVEDFACVAIVTEDGHPTVDQNMCAGCKVCIQVCPYGNIEEVEAGK